MSMMSNGYLQSSLHREAPLPNQAMKTRFSMAYLQRAEADTRLTGLQSPLFPPPAEGSEVLTSGEWLDRKFEMIRAQAHDEKQWVLTGRAGKVPA